MRYFVRANQFHTPGTPFSPLMATVNATTPEAALTQYMASYSGQAGICTANCYDSDAARARNTQPLAVWASNHESERQRLTKGLPGHGFAMYAPGDFEIDGQRHTVANPKGGRTT